MHAILYDDAASRELVALCEEWMTKTTLEGEEEEVYGSDDSDIPRPQNDMSSALLSPRHCKNTITRCISRGANVMFNEDPSRPHPLLHELVMKGCTDLVVWCLEAEASQPFPVDFTICSGEFKQTALHCMAAGTLSAGDSARMLRALIHHLEHHPGDKIEWMQADSFGKTFLAVASWAQKLHVVWPIVRSTPFFADRTEPLPLRGFKVWSPDWAALDATTGGDGGENYQTDFVRSGANTIDVEPPTARLCQLSWERMGRCAEREAAMVEEVRAAVTDGGDVCWNYPGTASALRFFIQVGRVRCVEACLETRRRIEFIQLSARGDERNILNALWRPPEKSLAVVRGVLKAVMRRLRSHPEEEREQPSSSTPTAGAYAQFEQRWHPVLLDSGFLSNAAGCGRLSEVWGILEDYEEGALLPKGIAQGRRRRKSETRQVDAKAVEGQEIPLSMFLPISISKAVKEEDWERLSEEARRCFVLQWD